MEKEAVLIKTYSNPSKNKNNDVVTSSYQIIYIPYSPKIHYLSNSISVVQFSKFNSVFGLVITIKVKALATITVTVTLKDNIAIQ